MVTVVLAVVDGVLLPLAPNATVGSFRSYLMLIGSDVSDMLPSLSMALNITVSFLASL